MKNVDHEIDRVLPYASIRYQFPTLPFSNFKTVDEVFIAERKQCKKIKLLKNVNVLDDINGCLRSINADLIQGGTLEGYFQNTNLNHKKGLTKFKVFRSLVKAFDFLFHQVLPKSPYSENYYYLTKGKSKRISKAEILGRLVYCGFEIKSTQEINDLIYFKVEKVSEPMSTQKVSSGLLYAMPRIGKNGKIIRVYKFRTMFPYSEFLQRYLIDSKGYASTGKIKDDFRVTKLGKFLRRYWLDELPQLINVLKGEMKLVGLRPVSRTYFKDLPSDLQEKRILNKPGCIPPYVSFNRGSSVDSVLEAEREYLNYSSEKRFADFKLLFSAVYHIVITGKRSA